MAEEKIIELVRMQTVLYDTNHDDYMKAKLKASIWSDIAKKLKFKSGYEVKTIWLKLRGSYRDAKRRQQKMKSTYGPITIKPWKYQHQMTFLDQYMSTAQCSEENLSNDIDTNSLLTPIDTLAIESVMGNTNDEPSLDNSIGQLLSDENDASINEVSNEQSITSDKIDNDRRNLKRTLYMQPTNVAKKPKPNYNVYDMIKRPMEQRDERTPNRKEDRRMFLEENDKTDDPLYTFFMSMYQTTKRMTPNYQHVVRSQIFQAVSEAEADFMNIPCVSFKSRSSESFELSRPLATYIKPEADEVNESSELDSN